MTLFLLRPRLHQLKIIILNTVSTPAAAAVIFSLVNLNLVGHAVEATHDGVDDVQEETNDPSLI